MKPLGTHNYFVYLLTNKNRTVLYIGVTNDLKERLYYHRNPVSVPGKIPFTTKYNCYFLVYYERFEDVQAAIDREKQIKNWNREKKDKLITNFNPDWKFLNDDI